MEQNRYDETWFAGQRESAFQGARVIVPILMELLKPVSVVDVGCGTGAWLHTFLGQGVPVVLGLDGEYVNPEQLTIPKDRFIATDLKQPFEVQQRFDLALSLEVAEHLPATSAAGFVKSLTKLAPVVCFSAAIPHQGGTNHINEQWPEYWANKFKALGFTPFDVIRHRIWNNDEIPFWYSQNILLFVNQNETGAPKLEANGGCGFNSLPVVHPKLFLSQIENQRFTTRLKRMPRALLGGIKRSLKAPFEKKS